MEKLKKIIAETFRINESEITEHLRMEDIDSWDSLTHMELIAELEDKFQVEFTADEIMEMVNVERIMELVGAKTNGN